MRNKMLKAAAKAAKQSRWSKTGKLGAVYKDSYDCTIWIEYRDITDEPYVSISYTIEAMKYCKLTLTAELALDINHITVKNITDTVNRLRDVLMPGYLDILEQDMKLKIKEGEQNV